ncbi:MAG: DUF983 domain-containing protein [Planctomycetes bacterium]|nr:DUF983 domain-containing protein [Planctomycetota bacterium]
MTTDAPGRWTFFRRALRKRCPQCGKGALFARFARLHERCGECDLQFRREAGAQTGSMYFSAAVTEIFAMAVALSLFFFTDWSKPVALSVGVIVVLGFSYCFLPIGMAFWTAVEYSVDVSNGESWVAPRSDA